MRNSRNLLGFAIISVVSCAIGVGCKKRSQTETTDSSQSMNLTVTPDTTYLELSASPLPAVNPGDMQVTGTATASTLGGYTFLALEFTNDDKADAVDFKITGPNNFSLEDTTSLPYTVVKNLPLGDLTVKIRSCVRENRTLSRDAKYLVQDPLNQGVSLYCNDKVIPLSYKNSVNADSILAALFLKDQDIDHQIRSISFQIYTKLQSYVAQKTSAAQNPQVTPILANILAMGPDYFIDWVNSPNFDSTVQGILAEMGGASRVDTDSTISYQLGTTFDPTPVYLSLLSIGAMAVAADAAYSSASQGGLGLVQEEFSWQVIAQIKASKRAKITVVLDRLQTAVYEVQQQRDLRLRGKSPSGADLAVPLTRQQKDRLALTHLEDQRALIAFEERVSPPKTDLEKALMELNKMQFDTPDPNNVAARNDFEAKQLPVEARKELLLLAEYESLLSQMNQIQTLKESGNASKRDISALQIEVNDQVRELHRILRSREISMPQADQDLIRNKAILENYLAGRTDLSKLNTEFKDSVSLQRDKVSQFRGILTSWEKKGNIPKGTTAEIFPPPKAEEKTTKTPVSEVESPKKMVYEEVVTKGGPKTRSRGVRGFIGDLFSRLGGLATRLGLADSSPSTNWELIFDKASILRLLDLKNQEAQVDSDIASALVNQ